MRESMEFDVVIVGAGPAGLAAALRLKQCSPSLTVCVVEKGSEVGAHILSGAVIEPRALAELLPAWQSENAPLTTPAGNDVFRLLTPTRSWRLPTPPQMHNAGNFIGSLGDLCRWLGQQAEAAGVEVYAGFAAVEFLEEDGRVVGIATGDMGIVKSGEQGGNHQPGMELRAAYTLVAEGCRGSLSRQLMERFGLRADCNPQTYALGVKELWEVPASGHRPGLIEHTVGWPLDRRTYGGSFLYHWGERFVSYGFVVGLDYENPTLSPFEEAQRWKTHVATRHHFEGGRRVGYGARALSEGGVQSLPRLVFPGGMLLGDAAGFLNVPKIKGTHTAMKSGMLAAESVAEALAEGRPAVVAGFESRVRASWLWEELLAARNIRPGFSRFGFIGGMAHAAVDTYVLRGRAPWTLAHGHADHETLRPLAESVPIAYPKPDGVLTFDRLSSVYMSNTNHEEDQPAHLVLREPAVWPLVNLERYGSPESRYCPAGVYETVPDGDTMKLQINAQNCVHCKTCDIKDPTQNIIWRPPEGGGGPSYPGGM